MWPQILKLVLGLALSYIASLLAPRPKPPNPAALDDFNIPQTTEGAEAGKVYGTAWIENPQVVWFGDLKTIAIKESGGKK